MNEKVSVIMPLYNAAAYMTESIRSIMEQTYSNLEILLVDDGSTDDTLSIATALQKEDDRIYIISQKNAGPGAARNNGIAQSKGEFICFVDSDDFLKDVAIERMLAEIGEADFLQCRSQKIYSDGREDKDIWEEKALTLNSFQAMEDYLYNSTPVVRFSVWGKLYRKTALLGIVFPSLKNSEDVVFNAEVIANNHVIKYIPETLYFVTIRADSLSHRKITMEKVRAAFACSKHILSIVENIASYNVFQSRVQWTMQLTLMHNACLLAKGNAYDKENRKEIVKMSKSEKLSKKISLNKRWMVKVFRAFPNMFVKVFKNKLS